MGEIPSKLGNLMIPDHWRKFFPPPEKFWAEEFWMFVGGPLRLPYNIYHCRDHKPERNFWVTFNKKLVDGYNKQKWSKLNNLMQFAVCNSILSQDWFQWSLNGITHSWLQHLASPPRPYGSRDQSLRVERRFVAIGAWFRHRSWNWGGFIISMSSFLEHYVQVSWISWTDMNWTNDILYKTTNE